MKCAMPAARAPGARVSPLASSVSASRACSSRKGTPCARASRGVSNTCAPPTVNASAPSAPRMNSRLPTMAASSPGTGVRPLYAAIRRPQFGVRHRIPARSVDQLIALEEGIRTGEVADIGGVADDAHAAPPGMKLERRRLHLEARRGIRREIQRHLVRRARAGGCDRAGEAVLDRPMQMAAQEALDLRMPRDHFRERVAALEADAIHVS